MCIVYFGNDHRNVLCPSVCRVVRNYGDLGFCVFFLKSFYFILFHVNGTENKIAELCHFICISSVNDYHISILCGHFGLKLPARAYSFLVGFSCASRRSGKCCNFKIRMIIKESKESLTYHTGGAYYSNAFFVHNMYLVKWKYAILYHINCILSIVFK